MLRRLRPGRACTMGLAALAAACELSGPPSHSTAQLLVRADVSHTTVATVVVEVSAADLPAPVVFNLPVTGGLAAGTIEVRTGSDRTITMRAFDTGGIQTHRGSVTVDVRPGANPTVVMVLAPLLGEQPIEVTLGSIAVSVLPATRTLAVGDTGSFTARIVDANGDPVAASVSWATLAPAVAQVTRTSDSTGLVTAVGLGEALVVAMVSGVGGSATITVTEPSLELEPVASGFAQPVFLTAPPGDLSRLFVVDRAGVIWIVRDGARLSNPFLDLQGQVNDDGFFGFFSMAFHPGYAQNGWFFVNYVTSDSLSVVERYSVSQSDPDVADAASGQRLLAVHQLMGEHNLDQLAFGPDGMLYISVGDGGGQGDPFENGQDTTSLQGKVLRLDVNGELPYLVPPDNPFLDDPAARDEIWAYGLRNPWRMSFDRLTGDLYIADNGHDTWEEVNVQPGPSAGGENYGWNTMEGAHCFDPPSGCSQAGLELPTLEYQHGPDCSVIGGYVYRGARLPGLRGRYFYADWCSGRLRSFRYQDGAATALRDHTAEVGALTQPVSFGEDASGELYVLTQGGSVFRLVRGGL